MTASLQWLIVDVVNNMAESVRRKQRAVFGFLNVQQTHILAQVSAIYAFAVQLRELEVYGRVQERELFTSFKVFTHLPFVSRICFSITFRRLPLQLHYQHCSSGIVQDAILRSLLDILKLNAHCIELKRRHFVFKPYQEVDLSAIVIKTPLALWEASRNPDRHCRKPMILVRLHYRYERVRTHIEGGGGGRPIMIMIYGWFAPIRNEIISTYSPQNYGSPGGWRLCFTCDIAAFDCKFCLNSWVALLPLFLVIFIVLFMQR